MMSLKEKTRTSFNFTCFTDIKVHYQLTMQYTFLFDFLERSINEKTTNIQTKPLFYHSRTSPKLTRFPYMNATCPLYCTMH